MINISNFISTDSNKEFSTDIHVKTMEQSETEVMYITITAVDLDSEQDYTVILNGLPTPKNIKRICGNDVEAAEEIVNDLKKFAVDEACEYWNFDKEEWETNLDDVLFHYKESVSEIVRTPNVDTTKGLMDVYSKNGYDTKVGVKKYLNGDYSNNGSSVELYTIDSDWNPKFYITISSKDNSELTDDIIKSHIEIFYSENC